MGALWAVFLRLHSIVGPVLTLLYPLFASIKAIESPSKEDDQQWLTYWILYSFITLFELAASQALTWFPLWTPLKLAIMCWLVLPQFKGATFIYEQLVRKYFVRKQQQQQQEQHPQQQQEQHPQQQYPQQQQEQHPQQQKEQHPQQQQEYHHLNKKVNDDNFIEDENEPSVHS